MLLFTIKYSELSEAFLIFYLDPEYAINFCSRAGPELQHILPIEIKPPPFFPYPNNIKRNFFHQTQAKI